jgi:hypothetical protein
VRGHAPPFSAMRRAQDALSARSTLTRVAVSFVVMTDDERRRARERWPVRIYRLGEEPGDDLSESTTPEERLEILAALSKRMWELSGRPLPTYDRAHMPVRIVRQG